MLQPLRIPSGWEIVFNKLTELEPAALAAEDEAWQADFVEELLFARQRYQRKRGGQVCQHELGIDLGWYPEADPNGSYCLLVVRDGDWETPMEKLETRSQKELVESLEKWLMEYAGYGWVPQ